ncbi:MAG: hypothetical protein JRE23_00150 [Deltaproteobacteria bacterium]|nr:hypothetical protein [Deltaproteobacteria bacterium]
MKIKGSGVTLELNSEEAEALTKLIGSLTYDQSKKIFNLTDIQFKVLGEMNVDFVKYFEGTT